jgi:hypothetical protein
MTIPNSQLLDLKEKAEKVTTKGPWQIVAQNESGMSCIPHPHWDLCTKTDDPDNVACMLTNGEMDGPEPDLEFIAACSPEVISTLVDEIVELRKCRDNTYRLAHRLRRKVSTHPWVGDIIRICEEQGAQLNLLRDDPYLSPDAALQAGGKE